MLTYMTKFYNSYNSWSLNTVVIVRCDCFLKWFLNKHIKRILAFVSKLLEWREHFGEKIGSTKQLKKTLRFILRTLISTIKIKKVSSFWMIWMMYITDFGMPTIYVKYLGYWKNICEKIMERMINISLYH